MTCFSQLGVFQNDPHFDLEASSVKCHDTLRNNFHRHKFDRSNLIFSFSLVPDPVSDLSQFETPNQNLNSIPKNLKEHFVPALK
jgi:hypothetical protein